MPKRSLANTTIPASTNSIHENSEKSNSFFEKSLEIPSDASRAMPLGQGASASTTVGNVGKTSFKAAEGTVAQKIKASFGTAADRIYIETVNETHGIEKYLRTVGKRNDAIPFVQRVRAAETMAQTMIGTDQYDITDAKGKGKRLGDGLFIEQKRSHVSTTVLFKILKKNATRKAKSMLHFLFLIGEL